MSNIFFYSILFYSPLKGEGFKSVKYCRESQGPPTCATNQGIFSLQKALASEFLEGISNRRRTDKILFVCLESFSMCELN